METSIERVQDRQVIAADQVDLIKKMICKGATDDELKIFIRQCERTGLDPFSRQIYAIRRKAYDSATKQYVEKTSIEVSIDGMRLTAQRTGEYGGQTPVQWCDEKGQWVDVWLSQKSPAAARVGVYRRGFAEPLYAVARLASYAAKKQDGSLNPMWEKMPDVMIAKVAEMLALRKAFPQELSGLYGTEEMMQADNEKPMPPVNRPPVEQPPQIEDKPPVTAEDVEQMFTEPEQPGDVLSPGDEVPKAYWSKTKEQKAALVPAGHKVSKGEDGKWRVVKQ